MLSSKPIEARQNAGKKHLSEETRARSRRSRVRLDPTRKCHLYAISFEGRFIKFGIAVNPAQRLNELQVASPLELRLLAYVEVENTTVALETEKVVHLALARFHVRGEWFQSCPRTLAAAQFMERGSEFFAARMQEWLVAGVRDLRKNISSQVGCALAR
jgi:hypothetical protein